MTDNYDSVLFPLEGKLLTFRMSYSIMLQNKNKKINNLLMDFKYVENRLSSSNIGWPTVKQVICEFQRLIIRRIQPLLGNNTQITSMVLASQTFSISMPLFEVGLGNRKAAPQDVHLYFVLQSMSRRKNYRYYVRGASLDLLKYPLSESAFSVISAFEELFTCTLTMLDGKLKLAYVRNDDTLVSCVFRGSVPLGHKADRIKQLPPDKRSNRTRKPGRPKTPRPKGS